jgi:hypothetical protein
MVFPAYATRFAAVLGAIALTAGASACGNDDAGGADNPSAAKTAADQTDSQQVSTHNDTAGATDESQIRALIADVREAFKTGDGELVCGALTDAGRQDIVAYGKAVKTPGSCVEVVQKIAKYNNASKLESPPTKILAIRVRGDDGLAVMRIEGTGPIRQRFRKIDGEWRQLPLGLATLAGAPTP